LYVFPEVKILLTTLNAKYIHINLAIRLLYELNKDKEGLTWKEFTIKESPDGIASYCADYDVVAFSCYIWNITRTLEVAQLIKKLNPETKILLGGPEVSYEWEEIIALPHVDYIITGEGEIPFASFIQSYPEIQEVPAIVYKHEGKIKANPSPPIFDLNNLSGLIPYINDNPDELRNKVCYIETSRGCPYKCEFCLASLDNKVRFLPKPDIYANLLYLMEHGKVIKFLDRTFNIKRDFTLDIFSFILENHKPGNLFQFEITADIIHPEIIQFIQEKVPPGLFRFEIGIQTVNQKANLEVSRKQNFDKTKNIILQLSDKIEMHLDLIVGLPFDYFEDIKFSFESVFALYPSELQLGFLKFLKGTPVREKYEEHHFIFDSNPPYQIIQSDYLSREELFRIEQLEEALEIYWNKKRAIHLLRYVNENYSIFDFLLKLGSYFDEKGDFHKHTLIDIYTLLFEFVQSEFPEDILMQQLVAIEYCLQHTIKPRSLFCPEVPIEIQDVLIKNLVLPKNGFRFLILSSDFDFKLLQKEQILHKSPTYTILQYDGSNKPDVYSVKIETPISKLN